MRKSVAVGWVLFAVAAVAALGVPAAAALAGLVGSRPVLAVGSEVTLPAAGVKLVAPPDPRLWGYDLVGGVGGIAFTRTAGTGANTVSAPAGAQLCVFDLAVRVINAPFLNGDATLQNAPTVTVTVGTRQVPVPVDVSSGFYEAITAVAVPDGAPVRVATSYLGFTQTMDLRTGRRLAPDPPALYPHTLGVPYLSDTPGVTGTLTQTGPRPYTATYVDPVKVTAAYLSYFPPSPATAVPPVGDAYLIVYPTGGPPGSANTSGYQTAGLPASAVTLVLGDGKRVAGQVTNQTTNDNGDLFGGGGAYYFTVPAGFTTGTIDIHPVAPVPVDTDFAGSADATSTLAVTGTAQIPVSFPVTGHHSSPRTTVPGTKVTPTRTHVLSAGLCSGRSPWS